jgi:ABC-type glutathione transport system ATPase component
MRVAIFGNSGSGKSTMARVLAERAADFAEALEELRGGIPAGMAKLATAMDATEPEARPER